MLSSSRGKREQRVYHRTCCWDGCRDRHKTERWPSRWRCLRSSCSRPLHCPSRIDRPAPRQRGQRKVVRRQTEATYCGAESNGEQRGAGIGRTLQWPFGRQGHQGFGVEHIDRAWPATGRGERSAKQPQDHRHSRTIRSNSVHELALRVQGHGAQTLAVRRFALQLLAGGAHLQRAKKKTRNGETTDYTSVQVCQYGSGLPST